MKLAKFDQGKGSTVMRYATRIRDKVMLRLLIFYFISLSINFDLYSMANLVNVDSTLKHAVFGFSTAASLKVFLCTIGVIAIVGYNVHLLSKKSVLQLLYRLPQTNLLLTTDVITIDWLLGIIY
jgi:hypothetical protein